MRKVLFGLGAAAVAMMAASSVSAASFLVTAENPRVQSTTTKFTYSGVEAFDGRTTTGTGATTGFRTNFGGTGTNVTGTYTNVSIADADIYGGANGTGKYAVAWGGANGNVSYSLDLATTNGGGVNYFGYWLSAADRGNVVTFFKAGTQVYSFKIADLLNTISGSSYQAYMGNPNSGADSGEAFAFLNFYDRDDIFDRVVFTQSAAYSGYESDNHTVGRYASVSGNYVAAVPEPATWTAMILGFGMVGGALRRDRGRNVFAKPTI